MKKLVFPVLLLVVLVVFCAWSTWRVQDLCSQLSLIHICHRW